MVYSLWCDDLQTFTQCSGTITNMLWWQLLLLLRSADLIIGVVSITFYIIINYNYNYFFGFYSASALLALCPDE